MTKNLIQYTHENRKGSPLHLARHIPNLMKALTKGKWIVKTKQIGKYFVWSAIVDVSTNETKMIAVEDSMGMYSDSEEAIKAFEIFAKTNKLKKDQYLFRFGTNRV